MTIHKTQGMSYLTSRQLEAEGITHGFFMRHGGCSPFPWASLNMATSVGDSHGNVIENRARIADSLNIGKNRFFDLWQIHSSKVVITDYPRPLEEEHIQGDAIATNKKKVALLMLFADCVPILFYDTKHKVIAIAHAGWKGTLDGVVVETIDQMKTNFDSSPDKIVCVIGPAICAEHYQVGPELINKANKIFDVSDHVTYKDADKLFMDLPLANEILLRKCGVKVIDSLDICTCRHNDDWFSHRAENGKTGRFAAVVSL